MFDYVMCPKAQSLNSSMRKKLKTFEHAFLLLFKLEKSKIHVDLLNYQLSEKLFCVSVVPL